MPLYGNLVLPFMDRHAACCRLVYGLVFSWDRAIIQRARQFGLLATPGAEGRFRQRGLLGRLDFSTSEFCRAGAGWIAVHIAAGSVASSPIGKHLAGGAIVYAFALVTLFAFLLLLASLSVRPGRQEQRAISVETLLAGFRYMWHKKLLLGVTTLDLFAVLLGGAVALLPIFAENILHSGPRGLGILRAAPALGALCVSVLMTWRPISHNAGVRMLYSVVIFGVATVVFGCRAIWCCRWLRYLSWGRRTW